MSASDGELPSGSSVNRSDEARCPTLLTPGAVLALVKDVPRLQAVASGDP
jgi:hypothetical protein